MVEQFARQGTVVPTVDAVAVGDGRYRVDVVGDVDDEVGRSIVRLVTSLSDDGDLTDVVLDLDGVGIFGAAGLRVVRDLEIVATTQTFRFGVERASATTARLLSMFPSASDSTEEAVRSESTGLIASTEFVEVIAQGVLNGRDAVVITSSEVDAPGPSIMFVNRAFTDLFGYAADEVLGETPRMLQGPLTDRSVLDRMKDHYRRGVPFEDDLVNYTSDGRPFVMSWKVVPVLARTGRPAYAMSMQRDVTDERRRRRFDMANDLLDTQLRIGAISVVDPAVPIKQTMTTLLSVQTLMLGAGVATIVLSDLEDREHRFSTALTDAEMKGVDAVLEQYGPDPIDDASLVLDSPNPHLRLDSPTGPQSHYRRARLVLSGVHSDWLRLADVEYHERLLQRVFSHNP